ncbi:MAG: hypothetical protein ACE5R6_10380 [Candidatus Heimdallarchaeota archaeon]
MFSNSFEEALNTVEEYYRQLMQGDLTPEQEAEIRVMLLSLFSTLKAHTSRMENSQSFISKLEEVRENVIVWNALGPWFREVKPLVDGVFSLITLGKELLLSAMPLPVVKGDEIDTLRDELREVKDTVKTLIQALEASKRAIVQPIEGIPEHLESSPQTVNTQVEDIGAPQFDEIKTEKRKPMLSPQIETGDAEEPTEDSFMELVSLEARKYAVEKAITNLETEFYEDLLPRDEFEKSLEKQRRDLAQIVNRISALRKELEASSL